MPTDFEPLPVQSALQSFPSQAALRDFPYQAALEDPMDGSTTHLGTDAEADEMARIFQADLDERNRQLDACQANNNVLAAAGLVDFGIILLRVNFLLSQLRDMSLDPPPLSRTMRSPRLWPANPPSG